MDDETAERLSEILSVKIRLARQDKYEFRGESEAVRVEGEIKAYEWCRSLIRNLGEEDTEEILDELEERLERQR